MVSTIDTLTIWQPSSLPRALGENTQQNRGRAKHRECPIVCVRVWENLFANAGAGS